MSNTSEWNRNAQNFPATVDGSLTKLDQYRLIFNPPVRLPIFAPSQYWEHQVERSVAIHGWDFYLRKSVSEHVYELGFSKTNSCFCTSFTLIYDWLGIRRAHDTASSTVFRYHWPLPSSLARRPLSSLCCNICLLTPSHLDIEISRYYFV